MKTPCLGIVAAFLLWASLPARAQYQGPGWALNFTASNNQYVQVPANTNLTPAQLTFEAWVNPRTAKCNTIISRGHGGDGNTTDYIFQVGYDGTTCGVMKVALFGAGAWDASTNIVPLNTWTHVAVTYDGTNKQFYINGVPDAVRNRPGPLYQSGSAMFIGRQGLNCNCNFFDGELDEVRIWNVVRTPAQIQQNVHRRLLGLEIEMVAYYRLDDGAGPTTTDNRGNGHTGTLGPGANAPAWVLAGEPLGWAYLMQLLPTSLTPTSATLNGTVNPEAQTTGAWFDWGTTPSYGFSTPITNVGSGTSSVPVSAGLSGLTVGTYYYRFMATNSSGTSFGQDWSFTLDPGAPTISNEVATNVSAFGATLRALVNPNGAATTVFFSYGTNIPYAFTNVLPNIGSQQVSILVSSLATNLSPGALHHFRVSATNSTGSVSGGDQTFLAAGRPFVSTLPASGVSPAGTATLNGMVFPNARDTTAWFQWGTTFQYGNVTPLSFVSGTNFTDVSISNVISGLTPGTTYHCQLMATNSLGSSFGGDVAFTSPGAPAISNQTATSTTLTNATLSASVRPNGADTTVWFEYGTTTNYGSLTATTLVSGTNVEAVLVSNPVNNLAAAIVYHFRAIATNPLGAAYGPDQTFTTALFAQMNFGLPGVYSGSGAWGDYDNDGRLDILLSGVGPGDVPITQVWRNTGNGFTNINAGLTGVRNSSAAWGDYDNDQRLDIVYSGRNFGFNPVSEVWQNTSSGFSNISAGLPGTPGTVAWGDYDNDGRVDILFSSGFGNTYVLRNTGNGFVNTDVGLAGIYGGSAAWGDYDNDGRLDLLLAGSDGGGGAVFGIWRNAGNGFTNINAGLPGLFDVKMAWGDYDNDGRLDMAFSAFGPVNSRTTQIWRNTGSGFTNINAGLPGVESGSVAWGDYDNDGRLDLLIAGGTAVNGGNPITQLWRNTGSGFTNVTSGLSAVSFCSVAWGDYDNDGRLDVLLTGQGGNRMAQVWQNETPVANSPPTAPPGLSAAVSGSGVTLTWNAASDAQTPPSGLTYNVRVSTTPGGSDIIAPAADPASGFRRLSNMGNAQKKLFAILTNLSVGTYYWSVQAIDTAFAGSPFAAESTFAITLAPVITGFAYGTNGQFQVQFNALNGGNYTLQASTNLVQWTDVTNFIVATNGSYQLQDPGAGGFQRRFYRVGVR